MPRPNNKADNKHDLRLEKAACTQKAEACVHAEMLWVRLGWALIVMAECQSSGKLLESVDLKSDWAAVGTSLFHFTLGGHMCNI